MKPKIVAVTVNINAPPNKMIAMGIIALCEAQVGPVDPTERVRTEYVILNNIRNIIELAKWKMAPLIANLHSFGDAAASVISVCFSFLSCLESLFA